MDLIFHSGLVEIRRQNLRGKEETGEGMEGASTRLLPTSHSDFIAGLPDEQDVEAANRRSSIRDPSQSSSPAHGEQTSKYHIDLHPDEPDGRMHADILGVFNNELGRSTRRKF